MRVFVRTNGGLTRYCFVRLLSLNAGRSQKWPKEVVMTGKNYLIRVALSGLFAVGLLLATGKPASADRDWGPGCRDRMEAARVRIDRDVARHGQNSPQVHHDVDKMEAARSWCRDHHADWDHSRFDVGVYIRP